MQLHTYSLIALLKFGDKTVWPEEVNKSGNMNLIRFVFLSYHSTRFYIQTLLPQNQKEATYVPKFTQFPWN